MNSIKPGDYNFHYNHELELMRFNFEKNMKIFEYIVDFFILLSLLLILFWGLKKLSISYK